MVKVQILEIKPVRIRRGVEEITLYKICYRYGDVLTSCIWIDEDKLSPDHVREYVRKDLENKLKVVKGELEI